MEAAVAGAVSLHHVAPDDLHGVQDLPEQGAEDGGGGAGQVVQGAVHCYNKDKYNYLNTSFSHIAKVTLLSKLIMGGLEHKLVLLAR